MGVRYLHRTSSLIVTLSSSGCILSKNVGLWAKHWYTLPLCSGWARNSTMLVTTSPPEYFPAATSVLLASRGFSSSNQRKTGRGKDSPAKIMGLLIVLDRTWFWDSSFTTIGFYVLSYVLNSTGAFTDALFHLVTVSIHRWITLCIQYFCARFMVENDCILLFQIEKGRKTLNAW